MEAKYSHLFYFFTEDTYQEGSRVKGILVEVASNYQKSTSLPQPISNPKYIKTAQNEQNRLTHFLGS
jgi:hypothetical protein